jgi:hypothetical protein
MSRDELLWRVNLVLGDRAPARSVKIVGSDGRGQQVAETVGLDRLAVRAVDGQRWLAELDQ